LRSARLEKLLCVGAFKPLDCHSTSLSRLPVYGNLHYERLPFFGRMADTVAEAEVIPWCELKDAPLVTAAQVPAVAPEIDTSCCALSEADLDIGIKAGPRYHFRDNLRRSPRPEATLND
jgi:hypothetical protein